MATIETTLHNFYYAPILNKILVDFPHEYVITADGVLRRLERPECEVCQVPMSKNGYNIYTKKDLGYISIGRWICPDCDFHLEEDRTFWENLKDEFFEALDCISSILRNHHVSYQGMQDVFDIIYPRCRETIRKNLIDHLEKIELPEINNVIYLHYDEQHPKKGRSQKFRLTLLDAESRNAIADELFDDKSPDTILAFLYKHLDPTEPVFIVTDFYSSYPKVFDLFFVDGCYHQKCLLHLNKLIGKDFPRNPSIRTLYLKYRFLDIFYDRSKELEYLKKLIQKAEKKKGTKGYGEWVKKARKKFYKYLRKLKLKRRRNNENLKLRSLDESHDRLDNLTENYYEMSEAAQKRFIMIFKNWQNLTMFHEFENAPATNNSIENYYSTSLKTHQKRQYTSEEGIYRQIKLARMKRHGLLNYSGRPLISILRSFIPFARGAG